MAPYRLDILFFKENDLWVGQCLQHDIAVQGENLRECMEELEIALLGRIAWATEAGLRDPFQNLPAAPKKYWEQYRSAVKVSPEEVTFQTPAGTPPAFIIDSSNLEIRVYD